MDSKEYQAIRHDLQLTPSEWCEKLGISLSSHKKFNAGLRPIPRQLEQSINWLVEIRKLKREILLSKYAS